TTLAAAAAVMVVIASTFLVAHIVSGSGLSPSANGGPPYSGIPPYYAYAVHGNTFDRTIHGTEHVDQVTARYVRIRATATGKVIPPVSPPAPSTAFQSFAGAATGRTFVLAANRNRYTRPGRSTTSWIRRHR